MAYLFSTFLCADPSYTSGLARLLDFNGTLDTYNISRNGNEADGIATFADWMVVGDSLSKAIKNFADQTRLEQT